MSTSNKPESQQDKPHQVDEVMVDTGNLKRTDANTTTPSEERDVVMITGADRSKRLFRAGLFSVIGIIILLIGVFVIGDKQDLFSDTIRINSDFRTVEGLKTGAMVVVNGIKVGTVETVELRMGDTAAFVHVEMIINDDYKGFLRSSTVAVVSQNGIIGEKIIELRVGNPSDPLVADGGEMKTVEPVNYMAIFDEAKTAVKNTENITASLDTLFLRFRRGEGTLGKFLTDDEVYLSLARVSNATEALLNSSGRQIQSITGTLDRAALNVDAITVEGKKLISDIGNGKGSIGAMLYDRSVYDSLEAVLGTLNEAAGSAGFAAREFGINMRGLRQSWLVGGLFNGGEDEQTSTQVQSRALDIQREELRRQKELLDRRERELMQKEQKTSMNE